MPTDIDRLRRHSRWLATLTFWLFALTALVLVVPFGLGLGRIALHGGNAGPLGGVALLLLLPSAFYLYALWAIRAGFREFGAGGTIGPVIAAGCTRAGWALAIGASLSAVGLPNLQWWLTGTAMFPEGMRGGGLLKFDTAYLAVGVVGLALILMGGLLRRAAEVQAEAAKLRDELDGFF